MIPEDVQEHTHMSEERIREIIREEIAASLVVSTPTVELIEDEGFIEEARKVAREEIRSLAGLALRRTQDRVTPAEMWGEVLADFSTEREPGAESGA